MSLTAERLRELFNYDSETGIFTRKKPVKGANVGEVVGCLKKGSRASGGEYLYFGVDYRKYYAHRLAWLFVHGVWPASDIDHIDGNRSNNAISNLRAVSRSENLHNQVRTRPDNRSTGLTGVSPAHQKSGFFATIWIQKKRIHLGTFATAELASAAYQAAKATRPIA